VILAIIAQRLEKVKLAVSSVGECGKSTFCTTNLERKPKKISVDTGYFSDLIAMLDDLKERGVKFRSLTEQIDTETPTGRAMWQMIGVLAELERSLISERTRAGVKAAQRRGVKFGRKPKLTPQQIAHARKLIDQGEERQKVADLFKVGRKTLYRALAAL
jgi:DNA invertase Pin-like site-specific DNA recombinase